MYNLPAPVVAVWLALWIALLCIRRELPIRHFQLLISWSIFYFSTVNAVMTRTDWRQGENFSGMMFSCLAALFNTLCHFYNFEDPHPKFALAAGSWEGLVAEGAREEGDGEGSPRVNVCSPIVYAVSDQSIAISRSSSEQLMVSAMDQLGTGSPR
ncbi:uncharacterized protein LY89DRAFT_677413 [Mollisia scopiformis]|uniref:Uncharacterized protein n=1 Tax=Mollisia scopiformis TaxID=149040 RepID=A0A132B6R3_MOLSC|nr:uncharacterized protein LY89DRAFT_677413 [Mollisia scopiformis]KUJ08095.1 hypothetical protein LY89DRAFT_677413 [Mollisia scopiformis]